ncbi:MAG: hypothetical protein NC102_06655 [Clostridium sp.]|nr:hypothetical protein [Clostridium sp.]
MVLFFRNMIQLMLSPSRGWEDVAASGQDASTLLRQGVIPSFLLAAGSIFAQLLFHLRLDTVDLFVGAFVIFVSYFVTLALAYRAFYARLKKWNTRTDQGRCRIVADYALGLMALTTMICNFMPITLGLGYLLPLAITLVVWKAMPYLSVAEDREYDFLGLAFLAITLPPILIQAFFSWALQ